MKSTKPVGIWQRILGLCSGVVAGLVLGIIIGLICDLCGAVSGGDDILARFAAWGAGIGGMLGFIFPRVLTKAGGILGSLIPGI
jgi:hypothetical protein